jgi:hypothetical protein
VASTFHICATQLISTHDVNQDHVPHPVSCLAYMCLHAGTSIVLRLGPYAGGEGKGGGTSGLVNTFGKGLRESHQASARTQSWASRLKILLQQLPLKTARDWDGAAPTGS